MNTDLKTELERKGLRLIDVARSLGVNKSTVTRWFGGRIPAERARDIERITGIPRRNLRPDLFPADTPSDASQGQLGGGE